MNLRDRNKTKKLRNKDPSSNTNYDVTINSLNNDCLIHIFQYLSLKDKLNLEIVCKRWRDIAKYSWSSVTSVKLSYDILLCKYSSMYEKEKMKNTIFYLNILRRSTNLTKLSITPCNWALECSRFLKEVPKYCNNLTHLSIQCGNQLVTDEYLNELFKITKNLSSVTLKNQIIGKSLLNLCADKIKEFSIEGCNYESEEYFFTFLSNLKNLNKLEIHEKFETVVKMLDTLVKSKCEDIFELSVKLCGPRTAEIPNFLEFILKLRKLRKLQLDSLIYNKELINNISPEYLKILSLNFDEADLPEDIAYSLSRFENLEILSCYIYTLNDKFLRAISECKNIKKIKIMFYNNAFRRSKSLSYFGRLKYLEFFSIQGPYINTCIDNILKDLSKSKSLKDLVIRKCDFTKAGLNSISLIQNLNSLDINASSLKDDDYINFIKNSANLRELALLFCNISKKLVNEAYKIKKKRKDIHNLIINACDCRISKQEIKELQNLLPLISVINEWPSADAKFM